MIKAQLIFPAICFLIISITSFASGEDEEKNVLAIVGNETITVEDFSKAIKAHPVFLAYYRGEPGKKRLLRDLMDLKLFSQEARSKGFEERSDIQQKINVAIEKILAEEYMDQARSSIDSPSENDLIVYYERNRGRFRQNEQIKIKHWTFESEQKARESLSSIEAGEDLTQGMLTACKDCKGDKGNNCGWLQRGRMSPDLEEAAFSLEIGEISGILKTDSGYHVIKLLDRKPPRQKMFFEVKQIIRREFLRKQKARLTERKRKELENKYMVKAFPEKLSSIEAFSIKPEMTDERFLEIMRQRPPFKIGE